MATGVACGTRRHEYLIDGSFDGQSGYQHALDGNWSYFHIFCCIGHAFPTHNRGTRSEMATVAMADMNGPPASDLPDDIVDVRLLRAYLASLLTPGELNHKNSIDVLCGIRLSISLSSSHVRDQARARNDALQ